MKLFNHPLFNHRNKTYMIMAAMLAVVSTDAMGYGLKPCYALVIFLLLTTIKSRFMHDVLALVLTIQAAAYFPISRMYGHPDLNIMLGLVYTNAGESRGFLSAIPLASWIFSSLILLVGILCIATRTQRTVRPTRVLSVLAILATILPFGIRTIQAGQLDMTKYHVPQVRFWADAWASYERILADQKFYETTRTMPTDYRPHLTGDRVPTLLVVIGESVRRDRMGSYGFEVNTTPFMAAMPGTLYTDYVSAGPSTVISLTHSLFRLNQGGERLEVGRYETGGEIEYNNSLVNLLKNAGYRTTWISNQRFYGKHDAPFAAAAQQADSFYFTKRADELDKTEMDSALTAPVLAEIAKPGPKVIFVHLNGSHPPACDRTGGNFDEFYRNVELSCYLQSVKNTDAQLATFVAALNATGKSWRFVYTADHGLMTMDPGTADERYAHGDQYRSNYDVPFFVATSDDTERHTDDTPLSGFDFSALVARMANVEEPTLPRLFDREGARVRQVIGSDGTRRPYDELNYQDPL